MAELGTYPLGRVLAAVRDALAGRRDGCDPIGDLSDSNGGRISTPVENVVTLKTPTLWYPKAWTVTPPLPTRGRYASGYPRGAVVHFTAGAYGLSELDLARQLGYAYFLVDEYGGVHQGFPLDRWGSHAGKSTWPSLGDGVSRHLVGIEVDCAGILTPDGHGNFKTWWGKVVPHGDVRILPAKKGADDNRTPGAYHAFTAKQEEGLIELLLWLKDNHPTVFDFDLVLGHDEVSPGRKQDPGASLSVPMPELRSLLKQRYQTAAATGSRSA